MKRPKQVEVQCQVVDPEAKQLTSPEKIPKFESQVAPILLLALPHPHTIRLGGRPNGGREEGDVI